MNDFFIVVGGGLFQLPLIEAAQKRGYRTIVLDQDETAPGIQLAHKAIYASTMNPDHAIYALKEAELKGPIAGVATAGTDASYTVACIAQAFGLPGILPDDALCATDKVLMRRRLRDHGLPVPDFFQVHSKKDLELASRRLGYPFVLKPARNMGARGVIRIDSDRELTEKYSHSNQFANGASLIAESYMDGPEYSVDSLIYEEEFFITGIADRVIEGEPCFVEYGHDLPANISQEQTEEITEIMKRAARALGIRRGAAKGDLKLTSSGLMIGEVAARISGGFMSTHTFPLSTGIDLMDAIVSIATGHRPEIGKIEHKVFAVERAMIRDPGIVGSIQGVEQAKTIPGIQHIHLNIQTGDRISKLQSNVGKPGNMIATGKTKEEALSAILAADSMIQIQIEEPGTLTENDIVVNAKEKLAGKCRVCTICDGLRCISGVPGMGGIGSMITFQKNTLDLQKEIIQISYIHGNVPEPDTSIEFLDFKSTTPIMVAPMSGIGTNANGFIDEREYVRTIINATHEKGSIAWIADGASPHRYKEMIQGMQDAKQPSILICKPREKMEDILIRFEAAKENGAVAVGIDLDAHGIQTMSQKGLMTITRDQNELSEIIHSSPLPVILKGIMTPADARSAIEAGAAAIVVSNHGGRVIDGLPSTISVLPSITKEVSGAIPVFFDGGVRSGKDVYVAMQKGATGVLIGRPVLIALAGGMGLGVENYIQKIQDEFKLILSSAGVDTIQAIRNAFPTNPGSEL